MHKILLSLLLAMFSPLLFAAGELIISGGKPAGMGYAAVTGSDLWSVCNNPAGMSFTTGLQAGIYGENRFLLPDLTIAALAVIFSSKPGAFGLYVSRFGNGLYNELKAVAGYSRKFGKRFSAGIVFDYLRISQSDGYGNLNIVSFEAGVMCRPDGKWAIGIHVVNPVPININPEKTEKLPVIFRFGVSKIFSGKVELAAEVEKALDGKPVIRAGLEYNVHRVLCLRAGYTTQPQTVTAGIGLTFGRLQFDLASSWQPVLGYSPQMGLIWKIVKR